MSVQITVRGVAETHHPAERALVHLEVSAEGADGVVVRDRVAALQQPLVAHLADLAGLGAVGTWSSDQVRVHSHRPWVDDRLADTVVHAASVQVRAEFVDFERLQSFVDRWSGVTGVQVHGLDWDLGRESRRLLETVTRRAAVDDAVAKAQAYADAVRCGRVVPVELADPGMLGGVGAEPSSPLLARVADQARDVLDLVPEDVSIRVEVDARFVAE